jgi:DNA (cytosine-5)-methyltransferase 1
MKKLRMLSLCSGVGGADLAAEWTGAIEIVDQVEINTFCQAVLTSHWPDVKRLSDIKDVQGDEFGSIDIVVGGIPCQPFSGTGKRPRASPSGTWLLPHLHGLGRASMPRCASIWSNMPP